MPSDPSAEVTLRYAHHDDFAAVGKFLEVLGGPFFRERLPKHSLEEFYRWKYSQNPLGEAVVAIAVAGGEVVSVVAATPKKIQVGTLTLDAYELGDFLTDDRFRKQGLFSKLIDMVCAKAASLGAAFAYVRPNAVSFPILARHLSFFQPAQMETRRFVVLSRSLANKFGIPESLLRMTGMDWIARRVALPGRESNGLRVEPISRFGPETDQLWQTARRDYRFLIARESAYLNWRYVDTPTPYRVWLARRNREAVGFSVTFVSPGTATGHILDQFTAAGDLSAARSLLHTSFREFLAAGVRSISAWVLPEQRVLPAALLLRRACLFSQPPPLHFAIRLLNPSLSQRDFPPSAWHLSLGDFDGA